MSTRTDDEMPMPPEDELEESYERTTIDSSLLEKLKLLNEPSVTTAEPPPPPQADADDASHEPLDTGSGATPHEAPHEGPRGTLILEAGTPIAGAPSGAAPVLGRQPDSLASLGPAFPDSEPSWPPASSGTPGAGWGDSQPVGDGGGLKPSEVPTNVHPAAPAAYSSSGPDLKPRSASSGGATSGMGAAVDAWDGFDDSTAGWPGGGSGSGQVVSGESRAVAVPPAQRKREYSRSDTNVYGPGGRRASEGARLVPANGEGDELALEGDDITVGREVGNSVVINDASVSRRHARIARSAAGYAIVDLGSGNGTFVNDERVEHANLQSGDEVRFGNVGFRFIELGDVFKPVDASGAPVLPGARAGLTGVARTHPKLLAVSTAAVLFSLAVGLGWWFVTRGGGRSERNAAVFGYYLQGVEQFKQRSWGSAEGFFTASLQLNPGHVRSRRYLEAVSVERRAEEELRAAQAARKAGDLAGAFARATAISDSVHFGSEAEGVLHGVELDVRTRLERVRSKLAAGDRPGALHILQTLGFFEPYEPLIGELRTQAEGRSGTGAASAAGGRAPAQGPERAAEHAPAGAGPLEPVIELFAEGKWGEALEALSAAPDSRDGRVLDAKIRKFVEVYEAALAELGVKRADSAIRMLTQALAFEEKITGGRSKVASDVREKLAEAYYLKGAGEYGQGNYPEAFRAFRAAVQQASTHAKSITMLGRLEEKARDIYNEGYMVRDVNPGQARDLWQTVLKMVAPGHELARKAKERIDALP